MDNLFKALSNETRRSILILLVKEPMAAGKLQEKFSITFASLSHHLSILENCGLVTVKKSGRYRVYYLNRKAFEDIFLWLSELMKYEKNFDAHKKINLPVTEQNDNSLMKYTE